MWGWRGLSAALDEWISRDSADEETLAIVYEWLFTLAADPTDLTSVIIYDTESTYLGGVPGVPVLFRYTLELDDKCIIARKFETAPNM